MKPGHELDQLVATKVLGWAEWAYGNGEDFPSNTLMRW